MMIETYRVTVVNPVQDWLDISVELSILSFSGVAHQRLSYRVRFTMSVVRPVPAIRPLEDLWALEQLSGGLMLEALPRGPVTPSGPSTCTNVPNRGGASCLNN
ncbi:hypothetical protein QJS10_CPA06g01882 [Acorus calamus]|uniref:Uncharacterized protein n=1 Tax=Acorus calamus TaxID=4465 RepID=A0AAV9EKG8_ACOCL|nr:hypothetical protein QJS10_CPA06g01882 [Acorus calamus]